MKLRTLLFPLAIFVASHQAYGQKPPSSSIPPECDKPELLVLGRPHMLPGVNRPQLGLSMKSARYAVGEPVMLYIWAVNPTGEPASLTTCSDLEFFKEGGFDLYDASGRLLVRRQEAQLLARKGIRKHDPCQGFPRECTRNLMIEIEPHTCRNGADYDFSTNLAEQYQLTPGEYTVHPKPYGDHSSTACEATHPPFRKNPSADITFLIAAP